MNLPLQTCSDPGLQSCGGPTASHAIATGPSKVMIIDGETIITGSFNYSKAAGERNAVDQLVITLKALATGG